MAKKSKPRAGSLQYYPRVRAKHHVAHFHKFKGKTDSTVKNFLGYKAGMLQIGGINVRKGAVTGSQEVVIPATIIEVPNLKIFGIRAYRKIQGGRETLAEKWASNLDKNLARKLHIHKHKKGEKKGKGKEEKKGEKKVEEKKDVDFKKLIDEICEVRLLAHTQPYLTSLPKKKPDLVELTVKGTIEEQLKFAEEKLGKDMSADEVFKTKDLLDIKAVTKGKGFGGVVKRYGVKKHRPKSKYIRCIGSIGPWHPATVMFTVPRAGQVGYHTRTEFNKRILMIGNPEELKTFSFKRYGKVKNKFLLIQGSVAGAATRPIAIRFSTRPLRKMTYDFEAVNLLAE
ncbi:MAG: 50S ribosomal protein L3 [Candidatus Diapherotrites archaeon CG08_land_8_20_14_0_20_34_12]|nr:MAG: 50S ribosomal protein L3 [Candidatus Diapherotrites archaeon CG08_land_8_20_14_0_20_34_12]